VCIALILVVLMQSAKGEGLAGATAFGGGVSSAVFGGRGAASFLSKATTVLAVVFMINCGALALMSSNARLISGEGTSGESAVTRQAQAAQEEAMRRQAAAEQSTGADSLYNMGGDTTQLVPQGLPETPDTTK